MIPPETDKSHHSEDSPSSLKNKEICPYYYQEDTDDEHQITTDGTDIHNWCEVELTYDPCEVTDPETLASWKRVENTPDLRELGLWCLAALNKMVLPQAELEPIDPDNPRRNRDWNWHLERRVHTPFPTCYGRADVILEDGEEAIIVDWKTGFRDQGDAEDNLQGQAYALGLFNEAPDIQQITLWFVYPRLQEATYHTYYRDTAWPMLVERIGGVVESAVAARDVDDEWLVAPKHVLDVDNCEYCALKGKCPAWSTEVTTIMSDMSTLPTEAPAGLSRPKTWDLQKLADDPGEMAKVIAIMDGLDAYRKAARAMATMMANERDYEIPGFKLVKMSGKLKLLDEKKIIEGMPLEEVAEIATVSASKYVKMIARKNKISESAVKEQLVELGVAHPGMPFVQLRKAPKAKSPKLK